jgi:hypothetical protein
MKSWRDHDSPWPGVKSQEPPFHRCLVISDPQANGGHVVLVRLTTHDGTWPDRDCILTPADWSELEHDSTVAYSTCKFGPAVKSLEAAIERGLFREISPPRVAVLRKVIFAAHSSAGMPPRAKRLLGQM